MRYFDYINNIKLIKNNFDHVIFELKRTNTSYWRVVRELHQTLYRAMIETLRGTANISITSKSSPTPVFIEKGDGTTWRLDKQKIPGCKYAWRYAEPVPISKIDFPKQTKLAQPSNRLVSFFVVLAMIQSEMEMNLGLIRSPNALRSINITDDEMKDLEFLHINIRNIYEHYIPHSHSIDKLGLIRLSSLLLRIIRELLMETEKVFRRDIRGVPSRIKETKILLNKHRRKLQKEQKGA
jgi:hypothetical protein